MIVHALYICSTKSRRIIWCEKVIFESDSLALLLSYTESAKPYGPPIMNTRLRAVCCSFSIHLANSMLLSPL